MNITNITHYIRLLIKSSEDILDKIPRKDDGLPTIIIKSITIINKLYNYFNGETDSISLYLSNLNLLEKNSKSFVHLFFKFLLKEDYLVKTIPASSYRYEDASIICVTIPGNGILYFVRVTYSSDEQEYWDRFFFTPGFDFESLLSSLWNKYNNKIYISPDPNDRSWRRLTTFSSFSLPTDLMYGSWIQLLSSLKEKNNRCREDNISRSYLFIGAPGSGKSTFALNLALDNVNSKILKFDAKSLEGISAESMEFLLQSLRPESIIIDDIDKIVFGNDISTLLYTLELIKTEFPNTTIVLTANDITKMDDAVLRPGRIDEIIEFTCTDNDRKEILEGYLKFFNISLSPREIRDVVKSTSGLTGAYIKEFVIQLKYSTLEEVKNNFIKRKQLIGLFDEDEENKLTKKVKRPKIKKKASKKKVIKKN